MNATFFARLPRPITTTTCQAPAPGCKDSRARELCCLCAVAAAFGWYFLEKPSLGVPVPPAAPPQSAIGRAGDEAVDSRLHDSHQVVTGELRCASCRRSVVGHDVHTDLQVDGSPVSLLCRHCAQRMSDQQRQKLYEDHGLRRSLRVTSTSGPPAGTPVAVRLASWKGLNQSSANLVQEASYHATPAPTAQDDDQDPPRRRRPFLRALKAVGRFAWRPFRRWRGC